MPQLLIKIKDKIAKPLNNCVICDNSDYTVKFIFDEEWEKEPLRIARFIWNKQYVDVQFTGDTCEVPVISKTDNLAIGVYAGNLRTTTPAILTCYTSILSEDVIEHSVTPSEYEEIMKLLNAQATDIAALKAVDKRIWTNLDTINKTASAAKVKAEEGVAKADDALTATRTNTSNINSLRTDVNALKATDERLWTNLDIINRTANTAKTKAEEGVAKADNALARNIFTNEEKAKLASITNPMIIKGRVDTVNDLPTEAVVGWFYFVGLESASSYEEYCYSENGWEYIGLSQEGVDLSDYYTKEQVNTTVNTLKAVDTSLGTRIDNVDNKASTAKTKAEEGVAKADNALAAAGTNATNINTLQTDVNSLNTDVNALKAVDTSLGTRIDNVDNKASTAKTKAEEGVAKADNALAATRTNANKIKAHANDIAINRTTLGTQCKNLLKNNAVTQTVSGVTFTVNSDGSVTVNGTNTSSSTGANLEICSFKNYGTGKLTASLNSTDSNLYMSVFDKNWVGVGIICDNEITWDNGNKERLVRLVVKPGATINNVTVYPMLRDADIIDDTYEPYKENIDERLIQNKSDIAVNKTTLGYQCKNLLPYPKSIVKGGITFTCDENGYMTASNTADDVRQWAAYNSQYNVKLKPGKYILSFVSASVCTNVYGNIMVLSANDEKIVDIGQTNYYNKTSGTIEFTIDTEQTVYIMSKIFDGKTAIMLRYADITDDTYEPYQPSLVERCLLKDTAGINLGHAQSDSITIDNLSAYTALWVNVSGGVSGINFTTNLIVPVAYLAKSTSNSVQLAGGIPSSAYITSEGVLATKYMDGTITAKVSGNTLDLTISDGTIGAIEVVSLM